MRRMTVVLGLATLSLGVGGCASLPDNLKQRWPWTADGGGTMSMEWDEAEIFASSPTRLRTCEVQKVEKGSKEGELSIVTHIDRSCLEAQRKVRRRV